MTRPKEAILLVFLLGLGLAFRLAIVNSFHVALPDGEQYYRLAQELWRDHRLAFAPPPAPLTHSRLPGYPIFLAFLVDRALLTLAGHVARATRANVLCDLGTAVLVWWLLRERGRPVAGLVALAACLVCPLLFCLSTHAETESLATLLLTLELWLALRAGERASWKTAAWAGGVSGLAQLVRLDSTTLLPAVALALWGVPAAARTHAWRARVHLGGAFGLALMLVVAAWPVRNWIQFGAPYLQGTEWPAQDGVPLPTGMMQWMRTWCTAASASEPIS